jgi:hypothetical protein
MMAEMCKEGIVVTIYEFPRGIPLKTLASRLEELGANQVVVDASGTGKGLGEALSEHGIRVAYLPKMVSQVSADDAQLYAHNKSLQAQLQKLTDERELAQVDLRDLRANLNALHKLIDRLD